MHTTFKRVNLTVQSMQQGCNGERQCKHMSLCSIGTLSYTITFHGTITNKQHAGTTPCMPCVQKQPQPPFLAMPAPAAHTHHYYFKLYMLSPGIIRVSAHAHIRSPLCTQAQHMLTHRIEQRPTLHYGSGRGRRRSIQGNELPGRVRAPSIFTTTYLQLERVQRPTGAAEAACCAQEQHKTCRWVGVM
jgi:hypothetical protein